MAIDNGRVEVFFTDSKGKFLITRSQGLRPESEYRITVTGDGRTFDTTTVTFKEFGVYYIPVFLKPYKEPAAKPARLVDLAEFDVKAPEEARRAYASAMRSYREGYVDLAVSDLQRALLIYPEYFRALNDLGVILMKQGRLEDAAQMFERATRIAPRVYYPRLNLAIISTKRGRHKEALHLLEQLYKEVPAITEVRIALGDSLMANNRLDDAEPHLRFALADPRLDRLSMGDVRYKLGLLLNRRQQYESAVAELRQAAEILPSSPRVHLQLGGALLQIRRVDEAERELLEAYRIGGSRMGGAQLMLGQIYYQRKRYDRALMAFEQYLNDVPEAPNAVELRGVIAKMRLALDQK
jgi:Flp pilus assembly protein TadD